ncbi:MAG: M24 family metallopeptidase [Anaerolineae bacterium]
MRADLDRLMAEYNLDAIVVLGDETPNSQRDYLTSRARAGGSIYKKRGEPAVYVVSPMEIDEAAKSGLAVKTMYDFGLAELQKQHRGDIPAIRRGIMQNIFKSLGISGRVGLYGTHEVNSTVPFIMMMLDNTMGVELATSEENRPDLFSRMYETKDDQEIAALRDVGKRTSQLVSDTWEFISQHYAASLEIGSPIVDENGNPLTIGAVKRFIRMRAMELDVTEEDTIFAQGRDAALPHSRGEDDDVLQVGKSIVYDIFPKHIHSGYYHDMTRTWCIGVAPADVQAAYDDVMHVFHETQARMKIGEDAKLFQEMALDYFESKEHPTPRTHNDTMDGYVHSLGHGLGLNIHEAPGLRLYGPSKLEAGNVFTVEPGLYYPDRGYGVRVEDTVYLDDEGKLQTLTDFRYDLVIPIRVR